MEKQNNNFEYLIVVTLVVVVAILSLVFMTQLNYMSDNHNQGSPVGYIIGNDGDVGKTVLRETAPVAVIEVPEGYISEETSVDSSDRK